MHILWGSKGRKVHWGLDEDLNNGDPTGKYIHIIHTHGVFT